MWYLATPYSKYADGIEAAFLMACRQAALLLRAGVYAFSPIAHSHVIAKHGDIDPLSHEIWIPFDLPFMEAAQGLIVVMDLGWNESIGVAEEIRIFESMGKPIVYMRPGEAPVTLMIGSK